MVAETVMVPDLIQSHNWDWPLIFFLKFWRLKEKLFEKADIRVLAAVMSFFNEEK